MQRTKYESLLLHTATIQRATTAASDTGTEIPTFADLYTLVACLIQPVSGTLKTIPAGEKIPLRYLMFFKYNQDILEGDQVVWNSKTFLVVQAPPQDGSGHSHHKEVVMEQRT